MGMNLLARVSICIGAAGLLVVLVLAAGSAEEGKAAYMNRCQMCHGDDGQGNDAMARILKVEFKAMDSDYVQGKSDKEIREIITRGTGKMAAVRGLPEKEIEDIIAYLRSLAKKSEKD
jgi:mono/diheme cytochrome c family protein